LPTTDSIAEESKVSSHHLRKSPETAPPPAEIVPDATDEFMAIFLEEAEEILKDTQSLLKRWQATPDNLQLMKETRAKEVAVGVRNLFRFQGRYKFGTPTSRDGTLTTLSSSRYYLAYTEPRNGKIIL
jgi:hypothetical protein